MVSYGFHISSIGLSYLRGRGRRRRRRKKKKKKKKKTTMQEGADT